MEPQSEEFLKKLLAAAGPSGFEQEPASVNEPERDPDSDSETTTHPLVRASVETKVSDR